MNQPIMSRVWAMPNKWTFQIKPIKELLSRYVGDGSGWADPFAGMNSPAQFSNDLNPEMPSATHLEALEFLSGFHDNSVDGVLFDPPYSYHELLRCYKGIGRTQNKWGENNDFWSKRKEQIARILRPEHICISFGWNSSGIGKKRGFEIIEILLVCHGGTHYDTIVTVERKLK